MSKVESVVVVTNPHGAVATLRFSNPLDDRFISANSKPVLYTLIEEHVQKVTHV